MRLEIERGELLKALSHVTSVVERRTTIPILSNVMLKASGDALMFKATDLEREVSESVAAKVSTPGTLTVPAHVLHDIVRKLPEGAEIEMKRDGDKERLTITSGHSRFSLQTLSAEDFPDLAVGEIGHEFTIEAGDLKRLIDKTRFAISTEETRYYLNGIYLHAVENGKVKALRAVATDGHRLAQVDHELPEGAAGMPGVIVPRKTVVELQKLLEGDAGVISIGVSDTKIRFEFGGVVLTSKLIDGTFPDYGRVIPADNDKILQVDGKRFAEAVDRVSTISTEKSRAVKLNLDDGRLTLSVTNPDSGSATEELSVSYGSSPIEIGFNARYLLDITSQLDGAEATFALADSGSPTLVRDADDDKAIYVLMPMRV
jgi:DNA polymerase-3 subunit beta